MKHSTLKAVLATLFVSSLCLFYLTACSEDDALIDAPVDLINALKAKYPDVKSAHWETRNGSYRVAEFTRDGHDYDVWFEASTITWVMTEIDYDKSLSDVPATVVTAFDSTEYSGWTIDEVDYYERVNDSFYVIEVEKRGQHDLVLYYDGNGNLLKTERNEVEILPTTEI